MSLANHFNAYSLNNLIVGEIEENKNEEASTHNENCKTTETAEVALAKLKETECTETIFK